MHKLMDFLQNPQDKLHVIHVAGTSGKTSTAYYIAALLSAGGYKVGLTISPHVDQLNERLQINGQPLDKNVFCENLSEFLGLIEKCQVKPSWFEVVVAFIYWYFAKSMVDYAVVEVGLGGLKDGTNVVTRPDKVCVITDIGLDHVGVLGDSLAEIATQKIGIVQSGNAVFTYEQADEVMQVYRAAADKQQAKLYIIDKPTFETSNIPRYQQRNWHLAREVYSFLQKRDNLKNLTKQVLNQTKQISIPARMDTATVNGKTLIMDGAHNAQKMSAFITSFKKLYPDVKPAVLIGVKAGREYEELVPLLKPFAARIITTSFTSSQDLPIKSMDAHELALAFGINKAVAIPDNRQALKKLLSCPEKTLVITGSFYLLGQIRRNAVK